MKAITTKFHGAGNVKGARYSASDSDGNRVVLSIDYSFGSMANHTKAAVTLCRKMGWHGKMVSAETKDGMVFSFVRDGELIHV